MMQVQVKNGERLYTEAPVRRETESERMHRVRAYHNDRIYIAQHLKAGKARFVRKPCK